MRDWGTSQHDITRQLHIYRCCIRQTIRKYAEVHTAVTKPGAASLPKTIECERRLMKFEQLRDDTYVWNDLVRYSHTNLNLSVSRSIISRILENFNTIPYIAPRRHHITSVQWHNRITWCYEHLNWSVSEWSNVIFSDESNHQILNRKNWICIHRFCRSQQRVHKGGVIGVWSFITCHGLGPLVIYDGRLNWIEYINILDDHLSAAFQKFSFT